LAGQGAVILTPTNCVAGARGSAPPNRPRSGPVPRAHRRACRSRRKWLQNPDFRPVSRCAACKSCRFQKSGIKANQWVIVINEIAARAKLADFLGFCFAHARAGAAMKAYRTVGGVSLRQIYHCKPAFRRVADIGGPFTHDYTRISATGSSLARGRCARRGCRFCRFPGVQIAPEMAQNRDFRVVSRCTARKNRRLAKSGIK
jgi:hypothetical protein